MVRVHEPRFQDNPNVCEFNGSIVTEQQVEHVLGADILPRFLHSDRNALVEVIRGIQIEMPGDAGMRAVRCTGTAFGVAAYLLAKCVPRSQARIMAFLGGPSTKGLGVIVSRNYSEPIPSVKDVGEGSTAVTFFEVLTKYLVSHQLVLDVFAAKPKQIQVGIATFKELVEKTGGLVVLTESFGETVFSESLTRVFQLGDLGLGLCSMGIFKVKCSTGIKVKNIIGPCDKDSLAPESWRMSSLDKYTSLCLIFDDITMKENTTKSPHFQFLTSYLHEGGKWRLRVTTFSRRRVGVNRHDEIKFGFDEEAAAVVMARLASVMMETKDGFDPASWLVGNMVQMFSLFLSKQKGEPDLWLKDFTWFIFRFLRSEFVLEISDRSLDKMTYFRMVLNRLGVADAMVLIESRLYFYTKGSTEKIHPYVEAVNAKSSKGIILKDSFFTVLIHRGQEILDEIQRTQPATQDLTQLLSAPQDSARN